MTIGSLAQLKKADGVGETIKLGVGLVVGFAADMAVTALLKGHIPPSKGITRLMIKLGVFAIAMKVGEDVENYVYKVADDAKQTYAEAKEEARKAVQEAIEEEKKEPQAAN